MNGRFVVGRKANQGLFICQLTFHTLDSICSLSSKTENINNHVVVFKRILFTEIAIILWIPKAACTHVESTVTFLKNNHVSSKLQILIDLLQEFDDNFTCVITPFLGLLGIVISTFECFENLIINLLFYSRSHFRESYLLLLSISSFVVFVHLRDNIQF